MWVCVDCGYVHDYDAEGCIYCGGRLRKRTLSEGIIALFDWHDVEMACAKVLCSRCNKNVTLKAPSTICPSCGHKMTKGESVKRENSIED
jgi:rRNA maturation endonuclease Nob1